MTMKPRWLAVGLVVAGCVVALLPAGAEAQKKTSKGKTEAEQHAAEIEAITTAYQLAEFGRKHKSPLALITAGGLLRNLAAVEAKLGTITEKPVVEFDKDAPKDDKAPEPPAAKGFADQAEGLFDEARVLGGSAPGLEGLIKMAKDKKYVDVSGERGVAGGPKFCQTGVGPRATKTYTFRYDGERVASIGFHSTNTVSVTVVRQDNGQVVLNSRNYSGQATWYPGPKGGVYLVRVYNPATKGTAYYSLYTN